MGFQLMLRFHEATTRMIRSPMSATSTEWISLESVVSFAHAMMVSTVSRWVTCLRATRKHLAICCAVYDSGGSPRQDPRMSMRDH